MAIAADELTGRPPEILDLTGDRTPVSALIGDIVRRRDLLPMLANRDFRGRYRSSALGISWAVLLPLFQGVILAIVFSKLVKIATTTNYAAFVMVGMMTWNYLTSSVSLSATSITDQADVASRVYFPRIFLSGMAVLSNAPALFIGLIIVIPIAAFLGIDPTWRLVALPLAVVLSVIISYAFGAPLAMLNVYYRDVKYLLVAVLQGALYLSPVIYPMTKLGHYKNLMALNPASGPIELSRWSFHSNGGDPLLLPVLGTLLWVVALTGVTAATYAKYERLACDRL